MPGSNEGSSKTGSGAALLARHWHGLRLCRQVHDAALLAREEPFAYINSYYGLDVQVGTEFLFCGKKGVVVEDHGNYLGVRLYGSRTSEVVSIHPTWSVEYLPREPASGSNQAGEQRG